MQPANPRSLPVDVMRGLTLALMIVVNMSIDGEHSYAQLSHAAWNGLTLTDLVFPSFLFVMGAALGLRLQGIGGEGDSAFLRKVLRRAGAIFLCGVLLSWFPYFRPDAAGHWAWMPLSQIRILGVLQRIALCYAAAALIARYAGARGALLYCLLALPGYWALLHAGGDLSLTGNAVLKLDTRVFGAAHLYHGEGLPFDPEGLLSTLPAVVNALAGLLAVRALQQAQRPSAALLWWVAAGTLCLLLAWWWSPLLPVNKKLWTSTYVLCGVGVDLYLLALLVFAIDLKGIRGWTYPFEVLGKNTLFIYLLSELGNTVLVLTPVAGSSLFLVLYERVFVPLAGILNGSLLYSLSYLLACWSVAWIMDRRRLYVRL